MHITSLANMLRALAEVVASAATINSADFLAALDLTFLVVSLIEVPFIDLTLTCLLL